MPAELIAAEPRTQSARTTTDAGRRRTRLD
jgi:hypothetical protein